MVLAAASWRSSHHRFYRCARQSQGISKSPDQIPRRAASSSATFRRISPIGDCPPACNHPAVLIFGFSNDAACERVAGGPACAFLSRHVSRLRPTCRSAVTMSAPGGRPKSSANGQNDANGVKTSCLANLPRAAWPRLLMPKRCPLVGTFRT